MPIYTTADRLVQIMNTRNLKQVDILRLAKPLCEKYKVKLGRNDLSQYVSGKVRPGQSKLFILAKALGVNESWLMGFDAPMERAEESEDISFELTFDERKLVKAYRAHPELQETVKMLLGVNSDK